MHVERTIDEIMGAYEIVFHQVWYNRHECLKEAIQAGRIELIDTGPAKARQMERDIWQQAENAAAVVKEHYGDKIACPWTDYEWGMINGKLSALRWIIGEDWDVLDT